MKRSLRLLAVLFALAMFAAACGGDDDDTAGGDDVSAEDADTGDAGDSGTDDDAGDGDAGDDSGDDDGSDTEPAELTQDEIVAASEIALPAEFVIDAATMDGDEIQIAGTYSGDPQAPVATMTAAGWTHIGTRDGSFIHDFFSPDRRVCVIVYVLIDGTFGTLSAPGDDCATFSQDRAGDAKAYAN